MMDKRKMSDTLTICKRAGKLVTGFDSVKKVLDNKTAVLVLTTADISEKTDKEVLYHCEKQNIPIIKTTYTMREIDLIISKNTVVMAVTDNGFAGKLCQIHSAT